MFVSNNQTIHRVPLNKASKWFHIIRVVVTKAKHMEELAEKVVQKTYLEILNLLNGAKDGAVLFSVIFDEMATADHLALNSLCSRDSTQKKQAHRFMKWTTP